MPRKVVYRRSIAGRPATRSLPSIGLVGTGALEQGNKFRGLQGPQVLCLLHKVLILVLRRARIDRRQHLHEGLSLRVGLIRSVSVAVVEPVVSNVREVMPSKH